MTGKKLSPAELKALQLRVHQELQSAVVAYRKKNQPRVQVLVPVDENGVRVGQHHQRAKLTDAQVEAIRVAWEDRPDRSVNYNSLAAAYGVHPMTIRDIVTFRRHARYAEKWVMRKVRVKGLVC